MVLYPPDLWDPVPFLRSSILFALGEPLSDLKKAIFATFIGKA
jgi:hypothetical protein